VQRCNSALGGQGSYNHKADIFQLRTLSATVPTDFLFPDRIQSSTFTLVLGNALTLTRGIGGKLFGNYRSGSERIPESTYVRAGLRVVF
jgi:hypothetical protein